MNQIHGTRKTLSLEFLVYLVVLLAAGLLRFTHLGVLPLNDHEASLALQALHLNRGEQVILSGEPGYISLTTALFYIFQPTEFTARFWPALAGTLLVLVPIFFRKQLGSTNAWILAALLAFDPVLIGVSRSAEGGALALSGLLAAIGFGFNRRPVWCGLSLGLALAGGPGFWPGMIILAVILLIFKKGFQHHEGRSLALVAASAGITLLVISTLFLTIPQGISAFGSSFVDYSRSWTGGNRTPLVGVTAAWVLSVLPLLPFAAWGLIQGLVRGDVGAKLLGIWAGASFILALANPARQLLDLYWVSIPLLTLSAIKLADLITGFTSENRLIFLAEVVLVVALVVFSFMNAVNLVNNPLQNQEEYRNRVIGVILPLILLLGMTVLLAWGWSGDATRKGLIAGIVILASFTILSNSWKAASLGTRPEIEIRRSSGAPVGLGELMTTVADISRFKTGIDHRIDVQVVNLPHPSLEWALRNFEQARFSTVHDSGASPAIVLTSEDQQPTDSASYRGQKILWTVKPDIGSMKLIDWLKWSLFRTAPEERTELVLWARNDLFPGGTIP